MRPQRTIRFIQILSDLPPRRCCGVSTSAGLTVSRAPAGSKRLGRTALSVPVRGVDKGRRSGRRPEGGEVIVESSQKLLNRGRCQDRQADEAEADSRRSARFLVQPPHLGTHGDRQPLVRQGEAQVELVTDLEWAVARHEQPAESDVRRRRHERIAAGLDVNRNLHRRAPSSEGEAMRRPRRPIWTHADYIGRVGRVPEWFSGLGALTDT